MTDQVTLETKDTGASVDLGDAFKTPIPIPPPRKTLYCLAQRAQTGGKLNLVHTEVYEGLERAKKAARDLEQASEFKYVVFELGTVQ